MQLAVMIKRTQDLDELKGLVEAARAVLFNANVQVLEAPDDVDYPFPFPMVTVKEDAGQMRHFGPEAVAVLRTISSR